MVKSLPDIDELSPLVLKPLTLGLLEEIGRLSAENTSLRAEIARLQGLKGKPEIKPPSKPSGMDKATDGASGRKQRREKRRRGAKKPTAPIEERVVPATGITAGARFKGYETFTVQDLRIEAQVVCYRRERWLLPDGRTVVAPLPVGIGDHFGPELRRFILAQYHQGQTTVPRLVELLGTLGVDISKRQVVRILTESNEAFITEARDVLRAGLTHGDWISVDDTGARHRGKKRLLHPDRQRHFHLFRHHRIEKPRQLSRLAARRPRRPCPQRSSLRLHAPLPSRRHGDRQASGTPGATLC